MKETLIVAATKESEEKFKESLLAQSHIRQGVKVVPYWNHTSSLADAYNPFLVEENTDKYLVFCHSDVKILDFFLRERLHEAFRYGFDVVGVAGTAYAEPEAVCWAYKTTEAGQIVWRDSLSGAIVHSGLGLSDFGPTPRPCSLLDGVFLAVNGETVIPKGMKFDPRLKFDFYDLDFSQQCNEAGLKIGTWPIAIEHASAGRFGSLDWHVAKQHYLKKWKERQKSWT